MSELLPQSEESLGSTEFINELFHKLWGQCADGIYDKKLWMLLQQNLEANERARKKERKAGAH